jgi:hypothetical protein
MRRLGPALVCYLGGYLGGDPVAGQLAGLAGCRICCRICCLIWADRHPAGCFRGLLSDVYFYRLVLVSTWSIFLH